MTAADSTPDYDEAVADFLEFAGGASSTQRARRLALSDWAEFLEQTGRDWRHVCAEQLFDELRDHGERNEWSGGKTGRTITAVRGFYECVDLEPLPAEDAATSPGDSVPTARDDEPAPDADADQLVDKHANRRQRAEVLRNALTEIVERRRHVRETRSQR